MNLMIRIAVVAYFAAIAWALYMAWRRPRSVRGKAVALVIVAALFSVLPAAWVKEGLDQRQAREEIAAYREAAWAHFKALCARSSGIRIHKVVTDVDGLYLERPRTRPREHDFSDRLWKGDPYGNDYYGKAEIVSYLFPLNDSGVPTSGMNGGAAYSFVETPSGNGKSFLRFTRGDGGHAIASHVNERQSRYVVSWEDISTAEDRQYWIAGSKLVVRESHSGEVLAERIGYLIDSGFGSTTGGRRPWLRARQIGGEFACPPFRRNEASTRLFVERVLVPRRGYQ